MSLEPTADAARLRRRFHRFALIQGAAAAAAMVLLVGYFGFGLALCLPAFVIVVLGAVGAQLAFILAFRRDVGTSA